MLFHIDEQFRITPTGEKCKKNLPPPQKKQFDFMLAYANEHNACYFGIMCWSLILHMKISKNCTTTVPPTEDLTSARGCSKAIDLIRANHSAWPPATLQATLVARSILVTAEGVIDRRRYRTATASDWSEIPVIETSPQGGEKGSTQSAERCDEVL